MNQYWTESKVTFKFVYFGGDLAKKYYELLNNRPIPLFKNTYKMSNIISSILRELEKENVNDHCI